MGNAVARSQPLVLDMPVVGMTDATRETTGQDAVNLLSESRRGPECESAGVRVGRGNNGCRAAHIQTTNAPTYDFPLVPQASGNACDIEGTHSLGIRNSLAQIPAARRLSTDTRLIARGQTSRRRLSAPNSRATLAITLTRADATLAVRVTDRRDGHRPQSEFGSTTNIDLLRAVAEASLIARPLRIHVGGISRADAMRTGKLCYTLALVSLLFSIVVSRVSYFESVDSVVIMWYC